MNCLGRVGIQKNLVFAFIFASCLLFALNLDAQPDTTLLKKSRTSDLELQVSTYPGTPNPGSIWVNREAPYNNYTPEQLVRNVFTKNGGAGCDGIFNVTFRGLAWDGTSWTDADRALTYFSHGTLDNLGIENGLLLTTGGGLRAEGSNQSTFGLSGGTIITDPDLLAMITTTDTIASGAILEFDFIPQTDSIRFDYVFASEEYPEFVGSEYNDVFGFFISGPGIIGTRNIAIIPGTTDPVAINNVNHISNSQYYKENPMGGAYTEYDGHTTLLTTAPVSVVKGQTYHIKLAIANVSDTLNGSGVFLRAGSFDLGYGAKNYGNMIPDMDNVFEGCNDNKFVISVSPSPSPSTITLSYSGSNINDILQLDDSPMPTSIIVPADSNKVEIFYKVKSPVTANGGTFVFSYKYSCSSEFIHKTIHVYSKVNPTITTTSSCNNNGSITITPTGGSPRAQISIDSGTSWLNVNQTFTGLAAGNYTILVRDSVSCHIDTINTTINSLPLSTIDTIHSQVVCAGTTVSAITFTAPTAGTTFAWKNNNTNIGLDSAGINNIPSFTAINTTTSDITSTITVTPTLNGCEGTPRQFTITVNPTYNDTVKGSICLGDSYTQHGFNITPTAIGLITQSMTLPTSKGCDSIVTLQLTVNPTYNEFVSAEIYEDDFYLIGGHQYNTAGHYIVNLTTKTGCDSIVNLTLTIMEYPDEITAFSPFNYDGINDFFMPGFKVQIFNRYGTIIYETKTEKQRKLGWDGRNSKGKDVEPGLYFYILYNASGKPQIKSSVEVLKR